MVRVAFYAKEGTAVEPLAIVRANDEILLKRHLEQLAFNVSRERPLLEGRALTVTIDTTTEDLLQLSGFCGDTRVATLVVDPRSVDIAHIGRAFSRRRPELPHEQVVFALLPDEERRS